jgi:hypothetical protein
VGNTVASGRAPLLDLQTLIPYLKAAAVTRHPPRPVSFKALKVAVVMRHDADDVEAIRFTLVSFYFSTYILIKHFM